LIYFKNKCLEEQADPVHYVGDPINKDSGKVDMSEKSKSNVFKTEKDEFPISKSFNKNKEIPISKPAKNTERSKYSVLPVVFANEYQAPSPKIQKEKKPTGGRPYIALSNSVQTRLGYKGEKSTGESVGSIKFYQQEAGQHNVGRPYGSISVRTRKENIEKKFKNVPLNPYRQEVGRPNRTRLGQKGNKPQFYQYLPVTGSGGYSYNSGWSTARIHQDTVVRPVQTFPFYVSGHQQLPVKLS